MESKKWWRRAQLYRDIWMVLISMFLLLSIYSVKHLSDERHNDRVHAVRVQCEEANAKNTEAKPLIARLLVSSAKTPTEKAIGAEVIVALEHGRKPRTAAGRTELYNAELFIEVITPKYNCDKRVKEFT